MTRGRLWVCWDHCQAPWLTLLTCFHPHLESHIEVLWSTEQLFTLCMVVPSTVRSFRALTSLVAHVNHSHLVPGAIFLILEKSHFRWMTLPVTDLIQKATLPELGITPPGAGNYVFHSCKWVWELWMLTAHCVRDSDDGQGDKYIQKSYIFSVCFIQELVLMVMRVKPKYLVHLCHVAFCWIQVSFLIPCSLAGSSKASCQILFWRPFLARNAAIVSFIQNICHHPLENQIISSFFYVPELQCP